MKLNFFLVQTGISYIKWGSYRLYAVSAFHYNKDYNKLFSNNVANRAVSAFHYNKDYNDQLRQAQVWQAVSAFHDNKDYNSVQGGD